MIKRADVVAHAFMAFESQRQGHYQKFKVSLVYIENFRSFRLYSETLRKKK